MSAHLNWASVFTRRYPHRAALLLFTCLTTGYLFDVLFLPKSLSAFDIVLEQPSWQAEHDKVSLARRAHKKILSDSPRAHYPQRKIAWDAMRAGHFISFNPYIFTGAPTPTMGPGAFITSLPQLFLPLSEALDWSTWTRLILAAFFMYLLLYQMRLKYAAAIMGGLMWAFCLHQIVWLEYPQHLATQLWMPLLLMLNLRVLRRGWSTDDMVALGLVNVLFATSGYSQIILYFYLFIGLFNTVFLFADRTQDFYIRLKNWCFAHGVFVVASLLAIGYLWFEKTMVEQGLRGEQVFRAGELDFSLQVLWQSLLQLVPGVDELKRYYSAPYLGGIWEKPYTGLFGNLVEGAAYIGILGLFFALYAIVTRSRTLSLSMFLGLLLPLVFFWGLMHGSAISIEMANLVPLFGLGSYQRALTIISLIGTIFAAAGLSHCLSQIQENRVRLLAGLIVIFFLLPVAADIIMPALHLREFIYPWIILMIWVAAAAILWRKNLVHHLAWMTVLLVIIDLFAVSHRFNTRMDNQDIFSTNKTIETISQDPEVFRVAVLSDQAFYLPNVLSYYKLPEIGGYSTVAPRDYTWFVRHYFGETNVTANGSVYLLNGRIDVLRALNVKYIITNLDIDTNRLELIENREIYQLYKIKDVLPRAYCASHTFSWATHSDLQGRYVRALAEHDRPVFFIDSEIPDQVLTENCSVKNVNAYLNGLSVEVSSDKETFLALSYPYYDQWRASLNGDVIPVIQANAAFMVAKIPPGQHQFRLVYDNKLVHWSGVVLVLIGLGLLVYVFRFARQAALKWSVAFVALVLIGQNLFAISGIRNDQIPERIVCNTPSRIDCG